MLAPAATPRDIINRLNAELAKVLNDPATKKMLSQRGTDPLTSTPDEFAKFIRSEADRWGKVVRASGATAD